MTTSTDLIAQLASRFKREEARVLVAKRIDDKNIKWELVKGYESPEQAQRHLEEFQHWEQESQMLRWLADNYEQVQRLRMQVEERIRAVLQKRGRTELDEPEEEDAEDQEDEEPSVDSKYQRVGNTVMIRKRTGWEVLKQHPTEDEAEAHLDKIQESESVKRMIAQIRVGKAESPVPIFDRSLQRYYREERDTYKDMEAALKTHPTFSWISRVRGCGATLACKILSRFDPVRAPYDSSFWKYAGLSTVPGEMYRCSTCSLERGFPVGYNVKGGHKALGTERNCKGKLELVEGADIRVAQPRAVRGEKRSHDGYAKKTLWLLSQQWVKGGGAYGDFYGVMKEKVVQEKPGWAKGRQNYWALRKAQKLFLSHLWRVWREALGLPTPMPYAYAVMEHDEAGYIDPWSMVEPE